jgi:hypothetical protein
MFFERPIQESHSEFFDTKQMKKIFGEKVQVLAGDRNRSSKPKTWMYYYYLFLSLVGLTFNLLQ